MGIEERYKQAKMKMTSVSEFSGIVPSSDAMDKMYLGAQGSIGVAPTLRDQIGETTSLLYQARILIEEIRQSVLGPQVKNSTSCADTEVGTLMMEVGLLRKQALDLISLLGEIKAIVG